MSYCLNPGCSAPINPPTTHYCQTCGVPLVLVGTQKQTYRGIKCIGQGGFGRTFLAVDGHQQPCVVKQLLPHPQSLGSAGAYAPQFSDAYLQRFRQEAQRLAELGHHPQIPQLIDVIEHQENRSDTNSPQSSNRPSASPPTSYSALYLVQELIEGQTLENELTTEGPMDEVGARSLLSEILAVLEFIHAHQVIHRDIKPQNIIRSKQDGRLVLVDFGAAKRTNRAVMARTGTVIGSAGYAAPEQIMGKAVFASDLYSLGVTCVHALTGMHPFDLYSISQDQWVWTQYLVNPISPGLERLLNRLLRRAVNQRYRTAQAVLTDLNALPALSAPSSPPSPHTPPQPSTFPLGSPPGSPTSSPSFLQRLKGVLPPFSKQPVASPTPPWLAFTRSSPISPAAFPSTDPDVKPNIFYNGASPDPLASSAPPAPLRPLSWHITHTLTQHTSGVTALAISPDSSLLASGDRQGNILLWNLESGTLLHQFPAHTLLKRAGHRDRVTELQFTPDGTSLVSSSADGTLKWWDLGQRQLMTTLEGEGWVVSALVLHPDGQLLMSGGANGAIDLWDLNTHQFIQRLWTHTDCISGLALAPDGVTLLSSGDDGMVYGWDLRTAEAIASIRAHHNGVSALALDAGGQILMSGGGDRTVRLWSTSGAIAQDMESESSGRALAFHPLHTLAVELERVAAIAIHPSGVLFANSQDDTHIQLWHLEGERSADASARLRVRLQRGRVLGQDWTITGLRFSVRGDRLVSSSTDGTIKIWRSKA